MTQGPAMEQHILTELRTLSANVASLGREVGVSNEGIKAIHQTCAAHDRAIEANVLDLKEVERNFDGLRDEYDETRLLARDMVTQAGINTQSIADLGSAIKAITTAVAANTATLSHIQAKDGPLEQLSRDVGALAAEQVRMRQADRRERLAIAIISMLNMAGLGWVTLAEGIGKVVKGG